MITSKGREKIKVIVFLSVIATFCLTVVSILLSAGIIPLIPEIAEYFETGTSLFFPDLPKLNLLAFLPKSLQFFPLNLGHLIDIFLITNIVVHLESAVYHLAKKGYRSNQEWNWYRKQNSLVKCSQLTNPAYKEKKTAFKGLIERIMKRYLENEESGSIDLLQDQTQGYNNKVIEFQSIQKTMRVTYFLSLYHSGLFDQNLVIRFQDLNNFPSIFPIFLKYVLNSVYNSGFLYLTGGDTYFAGNFHEIYEILRKHSMSFFYTLINNIGVHFGIKC